MYCMSKSKNAYMFEPPVYTKTTQKKNTSLNVYYHNWPSQGVNFGKVRFFLGGGGGVGNDGANVCSIRGLTPWRPRVNFDDSFVRACADS